MMNLPQLAQDKANHLLYGLLAFTLAALCFGAGVASCVVIVVAAGKELYDYVHRDSHTPDVGDFVATVTGGALGLVNHWAAHAAR